MTALPETIQRERAGRPSKASRAVARSRFASVHNQHQGRGTHNPRALHGGYGCHQSGFSLCLTFPPVDWRRFGRRLFPHSHWSRLSSLTATNRGVELSRLPRVNSQRVVACKRSRAHSLRNKPCFQHRAYALHLSIVLSKPRSLAGSNNASKRFQKIGKVCQNGGARD